uniref:Uncharacterized protein n=1 Tax=Arundo donax TaxID=35708 RepID=A0A0A9EEE2_ARUDO
MKPGSLHPTVRAGSPHMLPRLKVRVPAGVRVGLMLPTMPHSTKGYASPVSYPLVHVTVISSWVLPCARRGNTGALGFVNEIGSDTATSFDAG